MRANGADRQPIELAGGARSSFEMGRRRRVAGTRGEPYSEEQSKAGGRGRSMADLSETRG